jgi:hypothetical protein
MEQYDIANAPPKYKDQSPIMVDRKVHDGSLLLAVSETPSREKQRA